MLIIGERLTSGNPSVKAAVLARDSAAIADLARRQAIAGADYLDIGTAALGKESEAGHLIWLMSAVQEAVGLPLSLDSQNATALRAVLPLCRRPPILNSFSAMIAEPKEFLAF